MRSALRSPRISKTSQFPHINIFQHFLMNGDRRFFPNSWIANIFAVGTAFSAPGVSMSCGANKNTDKKGPCFGVRFDNREAAIPQFPPDNLSVQASIKSIFHPFFSPCKKILILPYLPFFFDTIVPRWTSHLEPPLYFDRTPLKSTLLWEGLEYRLYGE